MSQGGDQDGSNGVGGRGGAPGRRKETLPGIPSAPPAAEEGSDAEEGARRHRVTLDFTGPPLSLPGEEADGEGEAGPLALDTSEFHLPAPREGEEPLEDDGPLDPDLSDLSEPGPGAEDAGHDAWMRDRMERGSGPHETIPPPEDDAGADELASGDEADALGLVERSRPSHPDLDLAGEMADRYALGDFTGALRAAELLLGREPDHAEAKRYAESSRDRLVQIYSSRLGSTKRVPTIAVPESEVRWLGLDHRAGFMLSRIDGAHSLEEIIDVSGMPRLEALKTLTELVDAGAIRFDGE